jgi:hypothetical protein
MESFGANRELANQSKQNRNPFEVLAIDKIELYCVIS